MMEILRKAKREISRNIKILLEGYFKDYYYIDINESFEDKGHSLSISKYRYKHYAVEITIDMNLLEKQAEQYKTEIDSMMSAIAYKLAIRHIFGHTDSKREGYDLKLLGLASDLVLHPLINLQEPYFVTPEYFGFPTGLGIDDYYSILESMKKAMEKEEQSQQGGKLFGEESQSESKGNRMDDDGEERQENLEDGESPISQEEGKKQEGENKSNKASNSSSENTMDKQNNTKPKSSESDSKSSEPGSEEEEDTGLESEALSSANQLESSGKGSGIGLASIEAYGDAVYSQKHNLLDLYDFLPEIELQDVKDYRSYGEEAVDDSKSRRVSGVKRSLFSLIEKSELDFSFIGFKKKVNLNDSLKGIIREIQKSEANMSSVLYGYEDSYTRINNRRKQNGTLILPGRRRVKHSGYNTKFSESPVVFIDVSGSTHNIIDQLSALANVMNDCGITVLTYNSRLVKVYEGGIPQNIRLESMGGTDIFEAVNDYIEQGGKLSRNRVYVISDGQDQYDKLIKEFTSKIWVVGYTGKIKDIIKSKTGIY